MRFGNRGDRRYKKEGILKLLERRHERRIDSTIIMNLRFSYDLQKDIDNFKITSRSVNNKQSTKIQALYIAQFGEIFEQEKLEAFIKNYIEIEKIDFPRAIERIENAWRMIEQSFTERVEKVFGIPSPTDEIRAYLTTDTRCSYNIEQNYFFVSVTAQRPSNKTIMHELLHFWTLWVFQEEISNGRITKECFNDVKESLTELLNIEFQDLLDGAHDDGYPQHQEIRHVIRETWNETKDIRKTFEAASKLCPIQSTS